MVSAVMNMKNIIKEEESLEVLNTLGLINNIEGHQEIYNHV